jgi:RND family efflux transporter MFP subunit
MMRKLLLYLFAVLFLAAGCGGDLPGEAGVEKEDGERVAAVEDEFEVPVVEPWGAVDTFVARRAARQAVLTGFTRARNTMTLVAEVDGRVERVFADVGDTIGEDGRFAELDDTFVRLDLENNRAEQGRLKSELAYHRKEMERYRELVKGRTAAQSTLDNNVRAHDTTLQQLKVLQVEERRLQERLVRHIIKAPKGWKVKHRELEPGEWVTRGQTAATLGNYSALLVPFALSSREFSALKKMGEAIELRLPDEGGAVTARVERVAPGYDPETRKINVDLEIASGDIVMRGGIRTELVLPLPDPGGAVLVPRSALLKAYEEFFLVRPEGGRVRVMLLGGGPEGTVRVSSPDVRPGDRFLTEPDGGGGRD